jgi:hypothetical protein
MSTAPDAARPTRPTVVDFFLLTVGFAASLVLLRIPLLRVDPSGGENLPEWLRTFLPLLPDLMRLPEGVLLLWPLFYVTQWIMGRTQALTTAEWLWVFAWVAVLGINAFAAWNAWGTVPESVKLYARWPSVLWYVVVVPSMAVTAVVVSLLGLVSRTAPPWTHSLAVALILWPLLPLAGVLALTRFA